MTLPRRFGLGTAVTLAAVAAVIGPAHGGAGPARLCVGGAGCSPTVQLAIDAARPGDTVRVGEGTFEGGIVITKDLRLVGAGARRTVIRGGGPAVIVFDLDTAHEIHVTLRGLTITGGLSRGDLTWTEGRDDVMPPWGPRAGGLLVDQIDDTKAHSVVSLIDCVVTRNVVEPQRTIAPDNPTAGAEGGGIANIGRLTLVRTVVSDNVVGGGVSGRATGGGIWNATGGGRASLTIRDSRITGNRAVVTSNAVEKAEGAGIEVQDGMQFSIRNSVVSGNTVLLRTRAPRRAATENGYWAGAAGVQIGGSGTARIESTRITGNVTRAIDPVGDPNIGPSALLVAGPKEKLMIRDTTISGNRLESDIASVAAGPPNCCPGAVVEIDSAGNVSRLRIVGNTEVIHVRTGLAVMIGTLVSLNGDSKPLVIADSLLSGNTIRAINPAGEAWASGGGILNTGFMVVRTTRISGNAVVSEGNGGFARGGGIWNAPAFDRVPRLTLGPGTVVTGNVVRGGGNTKLQGGGLYTERPVTIRGARILGNTPDQCHGCRKSGP